MEEKNINPEELIQKLKNNQLNDGELDKINGGGFYIAVDPNKCPYRMLRQRLGDNMCTNCVHNNGRSILFFREVPCCEFVSSGNWECES